MSNQPELVPGQDETLPAKAEAETQTKELTEAAPSAVAIPMDQVAQNLSSILADKESLKDFPIDTIERLFELSIKMDDRRAEHEYIDAMHKLQSSLNPVYMRGENRGAKRPDGSFAKYALMEDICKELVPKYQAHGFTVSFSTEVSDKPDHTVIVMDASHEGGCTKRYRMDAPWDFTGPSGNKNKTKLHGLGSADTYIKRRLMTSVFGIMLTDKREDDDGVSADPAKLGAGAKPLTDKQLANLEDILDSEGITMERALKKLRLTSADQLTVVHLKQIEDGIKDRERQRSLGTNT